MHAEQRRPYHSSSARVCVCGFTCLCVCVCLCVRVRARVRVGACFICRGTYSLTFRARASMRRRLARTNDTGKFTTTSQNVFLRLLHERSQWYVYAEKSRSAEPSIRNATRWVRGASGKWDARGENVYRGYRKQTPAPSLYARSLQSLSRRLDHRSLKTSAKYVSWCAA